MLATQHMADLMHHDRQQIHAPVGWAAWTSKQRSVGALRLAAFTRCAVDKPTVAGGVHVEQDIAVADAPRKRVAGKIVEQLEGDAAQQFGLLTVGDSAPLAKRCFGNRHEVTFCQLAMRLAHSLKRGLRHWEDALERGDLSIEHAAQRIKELHEQRQELLKNNQPLDQNRRGVKQISAIPTARMDAYFADLQRRLATKQIGAKR